jgi:peptide/nickel transport system ATP-binding protein
MQTAANLIAIKGLKVTFTGEPKPVRAVDGVDLNVKAGEVVALIGESGSGKSVTLRSVLRLHPPHRTRMEGGIAVAGRDVLAMRGRELANFRGTRCRAACASAP